MDSAGHHGIPYAAKIALHCETLQMQTEQDSLVWKQRGPTAGLCCQPDVGTAQQRSKKGIP